MPLTNWSMTYFGQNVELSRTADLRYQRRNMRMIPKKSPLVVCPKYHVPLLYVPNIMCHFDILGVHSKHASLISKNHNTGVWIFRNHVKS